MHTLAKVKNAALAAGDAAEPVVRLRGETEVVASADRLVANTEDEARQLIDRYDADPARVATINPGVDLSVFRPGSQADARRRLGLPADGVVLVFVGRVQPLKAPDVVLHAAARLIRDDPALAGKLTVAFVGGPSGTGRQDPDRLTELAGRLGLTSQLRLEPPCPQPELARWYQAATLVMVPSYSESFGLVAMEAQACGTPVVAASVGGLRTAVRDGYSGVLVDSRDPVWYARAVRDLISSPATLARLQHGAREHASRFSWSATVDSLLQLYSSVTAEAAAAIGRVSAGQFDPASALADALAGLDLSYESPQPGAYLVRLPGEHKLATMAWLIAGTHSLHIEAFFCRQPDENHAEFYRYLLEHNARMYGVHFALDPVGDVYLVGGSRCTRSPRTRSTGCWAACSATPTTSSTRR